ncbi:NACHT domain-containing protein [Streptomyces sp. NPDC029674]|uniref:NACHT domain-containing protein n=1 Tax=Streptomyces sp. NPDC029674 TaxID=3365297 RepID=UPI00384F7031
MAAGGRGTGMVWVGATAFLVAGALVYVLVPEHDPLGVSDRSGLVSMVVGLPGLVVALVALLWARPGAREDQAAAVARLAREVHSVGEPQWTHSLGGDLAAIDVTFTFRPYAHARAAELPATPAGQLERVVEDYRALRPRRLVVTGAAGAGKTVLARKLVMELNRTRAEDEPVAVLIALADWDGDELLSDWVVRHLERDFGLPPRSARAVMAGRMVLPVLDGLDEMDADDVTVTESRARRALEALATYQYGTDPAPLVLTCRTHRYDDLESDGSHILDAARIDIDPVTPEQAIRFLGQRGAARRPGPWQPVLDELGAAPQGVLATALSTPWRLTLASVVYERYGDPGEMVPAATVGEIADLLLGRFIEASVSSAPRAPDRYRPYDIHLRLHRLAVLLGTGSAAETDLVLHRLGERLPTRRVRAVVCAGLALAAVPPALVLARSLPWSDVDMMLMSAFTLAVVAGSLIEETRGRNAVSMTAEIAMPSLGSPLWRLGMRRFFRTSARRIPPYIAGALLAAGAWQALPEAVGGGGGNPLFLLLLGWLCLAVLTWSSAGQLDSTAVGPAGPVRAGWWTFVLCVGVPVTGAVTTGGAQTADAVMGSLLLVGLLALQRDWVGYLVFLASHHQLRFRLARFLDWTVTAGLMRTSGIAYQFRHREFQEWLVRHPEPVDRPGG